MIRALLAFVWVVVVSISAVGQETVIPSTARTGHSTTVQNGLLDTRFPIQSAKTGSYAFRYAGSTYSGNTDDFTTIPYNSTSAGTFTLPAAGSAAFTGSVSGTTLTVTAVASGALAVGMKVAGPGLPPTAAITALGSGTGGIGTYTLNVSATVPGGTGMTALSFQFGNVVCAKNQGTGPLTVQATSPSTISGAPGVISGNPATIGGPLTLFQNGEACVQVDINNNYLVTGFVSGTWYQFANNVAALQWTGLAGYAEYEVHCSGVIPVNNNDKLIMQLAYNGTFQAANYQYSGTRTMMNNTSVTGDYAGNAGADTSSIQITFSTNNPGDFSGGAGAMFTFHVTTATNFGAGFATRFLLRSSYYGLGVGNEASLSYGGTGPYATTNSQLTGIQLFANTGNILKGTCWLDPWL